MLDLEDERHSILVLNDLECGSTRKGVEVDVMDRENLALQLLVGFDVIGLQSNLFALRGGQMAVVGETH